MINITQLHKVNEEREKFKLKVYESVLKKCHERIKFVSKLPKSNSFCFYVVPNILYGVPLYDINACIVYVVSALIKNGFYVDAGCYHPLHLNNTYLLYKRSWNGINIDISEFSIKLFDYLRPNDFNINSAVSNSEKEILFYYQKKLSQLSTIKK